MVFAPHSLSRIEASAQLAFLLTGLFFSMSYHIFLTAEGRWSSPCQQFPSFCQLWSHNRYYQCCFLQISLASHGSWHHPRFFSGLGVASLLILLLVDSSTYKNCVWCSTAAFLPLTARSNILRIKGKSGISSGSFW